VSQDDTSQAWGGNGTAVETGTVDTSIDQPILLTAQKGTGGDVARLEAYTIEVLPAN
jgi:hypothetical protein